MQKIHENKDYYEAILQLRPARKEIVDYVERQMEKRHNVFVAKIIDLKTGKDYYLSCRKFTAQLARKLKKAFKAKIIVSRKLFTQDRLTSKRVYRMTYCARF